MPDKIKSQTEIGKLVNDVLVDVSSSLNANWAEIDVTKPGFVLGKSINVKISADVVIDTNKSIDVGGEVAGFALKLDFGKSSNTTSHLEITAEFERVG